MAKEIEKKFLLINDAWRNDTQSSQFMRQAYLANTAFSSIRIRIAGDKAFINIKSSTPTVSREEYEYSVPVEDAAEMVGTMCIGGEIHKTRHHVRYGDKLWEIDEFHDANAGLIVAEIELEYEDEPFEKPSWLGHEVSHLQRYYNPQLLKRPYSLWSPAEQRES